MTSVQNHLPPSNGNKARFLTVLIFLLLCGIISSKTWGCVPYIPQDTMSTNLDTVLPPLRITLMLPFYLHSVDGDTSKGPAINPASKIGVDYYKGVLLALDTLQARGLNATVHVYDTQNDEDTVKKLINSGTLDQENIIIGPVYNGQARLVAEFAKKKGIMMVAPLSPADNITSKNPNFVMPNPRLEVHNEALLNFALDSFPTANLIILYQDNAYETKFAVQLEKQAQEAQGHFAKIVKVPIKNRGMGAKIDNYLQLTNKNVVIIPSVDLPFLVNISKVLFDLTTNDYNITVMGPPIWGNDENLRMDYINALNVHFTSPFYVDTAFYNKDLGLCKAFIDRFGTEPADNSIIGYDMVNYLGRMYMRYGKGFMEMMPYTSAPVLHTTYQFRPYKIKDPQGVETVQFIENKFVNILSYQNHQLRLVTPRQ